MFLNNLQRLLNIDTDILKSEIKVIKNCVLGID